MAEPDPFLFECIGCGTLNPAEATVCAGCGHSFAGLTPAKSDAPIPRNPYSQPPASFPQANHQIESAPFANPEPGPSALRILFQFVSWVAIIFLGTVVTVTCLVLGVMIALVIVCGAGNDPKFVGVGVGLIVLIACAVGAIHVLYRLATRSRREEPTRSSNLQFKSRRDL